MPNVLATASVFFNLIKRTYLKKCLFGVHIKRLLEVIKAYEFCRIAYAVLMTFSFLKTLKAITLQKPYISFYES